MPKAVRTSAIQLQYNYNNITQLEKVALDARRVLCASAGMAWPWTLTFWPKNVIRSSLSRDAPVTKVWRKSVNRYWRYRGNIKLPRESRTDARTDGHTHRRTTRKHIASAGAYRRRRLKNFVVLQQSAQVQYDCNTRKKDSCIAVVLHLCRPLGFLNTQWSATKTLRIHSCWHCPQIYRLRFFTYFLINE